MWQGTLLESHHHWAIWAVLFAAAAMGLWAEKTKWGARLSGCVVSILATFALSNLGIIPSSAPVYDVVWSYMVPAAIPLLLFKADIRRILREAGPTLGAFLIGGVGTVLGTLLSFKVVPLGPEGWKLAGIFCATYTGGAMNFVAVAEALELRDPDLIAAGVAADNLIMTLYFLVLFALPSIAFLRKLYPKRDVAIESTPEPPDNPGDGDTLGVLDLAKALAISLGVCAVGFGGARLLNIQGGGILILTALTVLLATLFPGWIGKIKGANRVGILLMQVFFAAIGASANILVALKVGAVLFLFAAVILTVHLIFLLLGAKLFRIDLIEAVIASNANMGGPTTAAAMAASRGWNRLVVPAILCGTFGYAVATFVGIGVGLWLR